MKSHSPKKQINKARKELQGLLELHQQHASKQGGTLLLLGPPNSSHGKLFAELRTELAQQGDLILFGRAERNTIRAFAPLTEPISQLLSFLEVRGLADRFLKQFPSVFSAFLPHLNLTQTYQPNNRLAFFESLRSLFKELATYTNFTLLLLHMQEADGDSKDLIRYLAQHVFKPKENDSTELQQTKATSKKIYSGVLLLAIQSHQDLGQHFAHSFSHIQHIQSMQLRGFDKQALLEHLSRHPFIEQILQSSGGKVENIDLLLSSLSQDMSFVFVKRLEGLSTYQYQLLETIALLELPAEQILLEDLLELEDRQEMQINLNHLVQDGFLARRIKNSKLYYTLRHTEEAKFLRHKLNASTIQQRHLEIAKCLERKAPEESMRIAEHFLQSSTPQKALSYVLLACQMLLKNHAYHASLHLLEKSVHVVSGLERFQILSLLIKTLRLQNNVREALKYETEWLQVTPQEQLYASHECLAELYTLKNNLQEAKNHLYKTKNLLFQSKLSTHEQQIKNIEILTKIAQNEYLKNNYTECTLAAEQALSYPKEYIAAIMHWELTNLKAKVAFKLDAQQKAESLFQQCLDICERENIEEKKAQSYINLGLMLHQRGENTQAQTMMTLALNNAEKNQQLSVQAFALENLGGIELRLGEWGKAITVYKKSLHLFSRLNNRIEMRRCTWNIANMHSLIGDWEKARSYLTQSRILSEAENSDRGRAFIYLTEGEIALNDGRRAEALTSYEKSRLLFEELGEYKRAQEVSFKLGWAALELRDSSLVKTCLERSPEKSGEEVHNARHQVLYGAWLNLCAENNDAQFSPVHGLSMIAGAITIFEKYNIHEESLRYLLFLSQQYQLMQDLKSAEKVQKTAQNIILNIAAKLPKTLSERFKNHPVCLHLFPQTKDFSEQITKKRKYLPLQTYIQNPLDTPQRSKEWDLRYPNLIGSSPALLRLFERLDRISQNRQSTILIRGESGTGKELIASAIHRLSEVSNKTFISVNCAALVEPLLLSELFGHEKGSFTGAYARKIGRFELAHEGSLFLDEIGDISAKTQVALLRVLQEHSFERVGGSKTIQSNATVICATHRNLEEMISTGDFREDLYYRLRSVVIDIPPLRDRKEDISTLIKHYLNIAHEELGRGPRHVTDAVKQIFREYTWPGNIRELQNIIHSISIFCDGDTIEEEDLKDFPELFAAENKTLSAETSWSGAHSVSPSSINNSNNVSSKHPMALNKMKRRLEFDAIVNALNQSEANITKAAKMLDMKRPRLSQIINGDAQLKQLKEKLLQNRRSKVI